MLVTWILGGIILGAAVSAIIAWWNDIVNWVENVFERISSAVKKAWSYLAIKAGELKAFVMKIFSNGDTVIERGPKTIRITSREQLVELADAGRIPRSAVDLLWHGEEFTITLND